MDEFDPIPICKTPKISIRLMDVLNNGCDSDVGYVFSSRSNPLGNLTPPHSGTQMAWSDLLKLKKQSQPIVIHV